jgi:hypothetical protein
MSGGRQVRLFDKLMRQVNEHGLDPVFKRFNVKSDAGGLLEYRLTGFCDQWLDVMIPGNKQPSWSAPASHHYMLNLREAVFTVTRAHVLTDNQFPRVGAIMFPEIASADQIATLVDETVRHRRRIRSGLKSAVQSCCEVLSR